MTWFPNNIGNQFQNWQPAIQQYQYQPAAQQPSNLIRVTGMDGAKAYQMPANSVVPLFDSDNDIMYIKSTDGAGFPTIRTFSFAPMEQQQAPSNDYVTKEEFERFKEEIVNAKQPVQQATTATALAERPTS